MLKIFVFHTNCNITGEEVNSNQDLNKQAMKDKCCPHKKILNHCDYRLLYFKLKNSLPLTTCYD